MTKSSTSSTAFLAVALTAALLLLLAPTEGAVTCTVIELSLCLPALTMPLDPTKECCDKLKEQRPCLCGYLKDPTLRVYWISPNAKKVADVCGLPYPPQC